MPTAKRQTGTTVTKKKVAKKAVRKRVRNDKAIAVKSAMKKAARKKAAKKKKPTVKDEGRARQDRFLAMAKSDDPGITSEDLAFKYDIAEEDVFKMRQFVFEYIKDFDVTMAAVRMGYDLATAKGIGKTLFNRSYTQLRLSEVVEKMEGDSIVSGNQIKARLWKESNLGKCSENSSVRVSALKELARIYQLGAVATQAIEIKLPNIMIVPDFGGIESWEEKAKASQAALKEGSIDI